MALIFSLSRHLLRDVLGDEHLHSSTHLTLTDSPRALSRADDLAARPAWAEAHWYEHRQWSAAKGL